MHIWGKILGFLFGFMLSKTLFGALLGLSVAILVVFLLGKMHLPSWIGVPVVTSDSIGVALFVIHSGSNSR